MSIEQSELNNILASMLVVADSRLQVDQFLQAINSNRPQPITPEQVSASLQQLQQSFAELGLELHHNARGYRLQTQDQYAPWISALQTNKPPKYSNAVLETLALIAYRQPITRGEIEYIRGVSVSTTTMRTLQERNWVRTIGHRDVPGRPALYGTTREFLEYFNLDNLSQLPPIPDPDASDITNQHEQLELEKTLNPH